MPLRVIRDANLSAKHKGFVYQVAAVEAVKDLSFSAVFHEQGLGKTKIGVDLALTWLKSDILDSVLIVTKRGLIQNWLDELELHTFIVPRVIGHNKKNNFYSFNSPARIYLTHYEGVKSEAKRFALFLRTRRVGVILDEAHKIKNPESQVTQTLFNLSKGFVRRVVMTGTPVANRPYDLWSQIFFLDSGLSLGTDYQRFRRELDLNNDLAFNEDQAFQFESRLSTVFEKIKSFSVRETKGALEIQLPNKIVRNVPVEMEWRQSEIYDTIREEFRLHVVKDNVAMLDESGEVLKRLLRLVQAASNPRLIDERYQKIPGKLPVLEQMLFDIVGKGEKAIIWTSYTQNVDWLAKELREFGTARVHGKLSHENRSRSLADFKERPETRVLIATPASAKEGLTLTMANHAIFFDRSFSLDDYLQAQDRIHRISQVRTCYVTNLIAKDSIDEWVDTLLSAKNLAAQLAQGDITKDEYRREANYAFGEMVRDLLNPNRQEIS